MSDQSYPKWIYYYLCFVTFVSVTLAVIIYTNPMSLWGHWEAANASGAFSLSGPAGLFCARNIATAVMGVYILAHKSRQMMGAFLVFRIVVDLLDGTHALIGGNPPIIVVGYSTAVIEIFMFIMLHRHGKAVQSSTN
ncbi:MAG: hypothetical protein AAF629_23000 [Chloroflexota bacterium]